MLTLASPPERLDTAPPAAVLHELNWNRAVHVNGDINEKLVHRLGPEILKLRQDSEAPITVGIDSSGGRTDCLRDLQALLRTPDQRGRTCPIYTVALSQAGSAAGVLLASGDYAFAQPRSRIMLHATYTDESRTTAERAAEISRELTLEDRALADALGEAMFRRNLRVFSEKRRGPTFAEQRKRHPKWTKYYDGVFAAIVKIGKLESPVDFDLDLGGYAITLFNLLSSPVDSVITDSVRLLLWAYQCEALVSFLSSPGGFRASLSAGHAHAGSIVGRNQKRISASDFKNFKARGLERVVASIVMRQTDADPFSISDTGLSAIDRDYLHLRDFDLEDKGDALDGFTARLEACLPDDGVKRLREGTEEESASLRTRFLRPQAVVLWRLLGTINRRLFVGDNRLTTSDAKLLGVVDEVLGEPSAVTSASPETVNLDR